MTDPVFVGSFIRILEGPPTPKTRRFVVETKDGKENLGLIRWHGPWRKYAFFVFDDTLYEEVCLREIAGFLETVTKAHRAAKTGA